MGLSRCRRVRLARTSRVSTAETEVPKAAAVSALFILVNSIAGLVGYFTAKHSIPLLGVFLAAAAVTGGVFGSHLGSRHFPARTISLLLATVLVIAGTKLILTR